MDRKAWLPHVDYPLLFELLTKRVRGDSRAMLVAYRISSEIRNTARMYGVECHEIPAASVKAGLMEAAHNTVAAEDG